MPLCTGNMVLNGHSSSKLRLIMLADAISHPRFGTKPPGPLLCFVEAAASCPDSGARSQPKKPTEGGDLRQRSLSSSSLRDCSCFLEKLRFHHLA